MHSKEDLKTILKISLFCIAMSFFGFLYEEVVELPNMFGNSPIPIKNLWNNFHWKSNPAIYHAFPAMISLLCLVVLFFKRKHFEPFQEKIIKIVLVLQALTNVFTGIAVLGINDKLYFGAEVLNSQEVIYLATTWGILNFFRLLCVFFSFTYLTKLLSVKFFK